MTEQELEMVKRAFIEKIGKLNEAGMENVITNGFTEAQVKSFLTNNIGERETNNRNMGAENIATADEQAALIVTINNL